MQEGGQERNSRAAFLLTFYTFFLDNVLLTVVVPMLAPWVQPAHADADPADPADRADAGRWAAAAGAVLGAKAGTQLLSCAAAAAAVRHATPPPTLRAGTALLLASCAVLSLCTWWRGAMAAGGLLTARVLHGAGAALVAVAGWALVARHPPRLQRLLPALALGVVAGYVLGTVTDRGLLPFALIGAGLAVNIVLQYKYLGNEKYYGNGSPTGSGSLGTPLAHPATRWSRGELAAAGGVFVSTWVVATLEPCLPAYLQARGHQQCGLVFVADSAGYLAGSWRRGAGGGALGRARGAAAGLLAVATAALLLPCTTQVWQVCATQFLLGFGIGTTDVALFPAVIGPDEDEIESDLENSKTLKLLTPKDKDDFKGTDYYKIENYQELCYNNDIIVSKDDADHRYLRNTNPFIVISDETTDEDEKKLNTYKEEKLNVRHKDLKKLPTTKEHPNNKSDVATRRAARGGRDARAASRDVRAASRDARAASRDARAASRAALLHGAASAAYAAGSVAGSLCAWWASLDACLLTLGAANALYAPALYRVLLGGGQVSSSAVERKPEEPRENSQLIAAK